ncbi:MULTISPECIES: flagellar motor switch protein FliM [Capnocytophaga]|jgi:hypothetical protein|uniref:Flagellar motor switch protein FliM n=1 Tax=Capnocytophaga ochracea TaxID=1018 RepID=A0A2X2TP81_CAPOC|nr:MULTISPECIES: flagellar motor switch protein FliM [Capnocytophaga]SQA78210.1 Uncharacterised protein [Capnocytophaga ochracea]
MRTTNYKMMNYNVSIPEVDMPIFESLFKKYNVIVKPVHISEPTEEYVPNKKTIEAIEEGDMLVEKYKKGLVKGYTNAKEMFNDILSEDDE